MNISRGVGICCAAFMFAFAFASCAVQGNDSVRCDWELTYIGAAETHTEAQANYLADAYDRVAEYANGTEELSRPSAVRFEWSAVPREKGVALQEYALEISAQSNFSDKITYYTTERSYEVYNLCVDTDYYWRVVADFGESGKSVSAPSYFETESDAPRNLYVDGVTNVRDSGGWKCGANNGADNGLDGGADRVKQGLLYRCGRLNTSYAAEPTVEITDEGKKTMTEILGVRSEIDLRTVANNEVGGITASPLGESVQYFSCPMEWNVSNILTANAGMVGTIFSILANEDNYPVIYHCNIGTDRTGLIAFLVDGLAGVSEEDLYRDYLFSNFGNIGGARGLSGIQKSYVATIQKYSGASLQEKIENCLLDLGVAQADMDAVRAILTE
jgi:protein-tyrosine phosphatase